MSTSHSSHLTDDQLAACGLTREQFDHLAATRLMVKAHVELFRRQLTRSLVLPVLDLMTDEQLENFIALPVKPTVPTDGR